MDEFPRRSVFDDPSSLHNYHLIVVSNRVEPMGHGDDCGVGELFLYGGLNEDVGLHVYVRSGFVEHQKFVPAKKGACETEELLLADRKGLRSV